MTRVRLEIASKVIKRRAVVEVINEAAKAEGKPSDYVSAPSPRGSTYWRRLLSCPREHFLANVVQLGRGGAVNDNLDTGALFHLAMESYRRAQGRAQRKEQLEHAPDWYAFNEIRPFAKEPGYEDTYATLERMLDGYFNMYQKRDEREWEILAVEETLETDEKEFGFPWSARYDLIVIDHSISTRALRIVELKTSRTDDDNVIQGYQQDLQILGQIWLAEAEIALDKYPPFLGSIVDIVTKHKAGPRCHRVPVQPEVAQLLNWENAMRRFWKMHLLYEDMHYPQNFAQCKRLYGRCDYFDFCRFSPHLSVDDIRSIATEQREQHAADQKH